jgi:hypothetical protein
MCKDAVAILGDSHEATYELIRDQSQAALKRVPTVEDLLSSVRDKIAAMSDADTLASANRRELEAIEKAIRTTIAQAAKPAEDRIPERLPHHLLAQWLGRIDRKVPVELFTTNYDTLIERALEDERIPAFDGFVGSRRPFFAGTTLVQHDTSPPRRWTRLWKIHGSINWHRELDPDDTLRITREEEHIGGELIYPSAHKYDESRKQPYFAMLEHLGRVLNRREETVLLTVGYGFGDQHINGVLYEALEARPRTHVISLQYAELPDAHELIRRATHRHNLLVMGPDTAVIAGARAPWQLLEAVDERTADLLDIPFDSDAEPEEDTPGLTGRFRLGNFEWFARFLTGIAGADD